jgi:hypothetical protein
MFIRTPIVEALVKATGDDLWAEHPKYPKRDWQFEVENGDLMLGYWEYVASKLDEDGRELPGLSDEQRASAIRQLRASGLTIEECINVFAVANDNPYVGKARELIAGGDDLEIDEQTAIASSESGGAWVLSWLWVSNEEAGVLPYSEALESVLDKSRVGNLEHPEPDVLKAKAAWLEDLISNFADELDNIETEPLLPGKVPGAIDWHQDDRVYTFMPSVAISDLRLIARQRGLDDLTSDVVEKFIQRFGNKLDATLRVLHPDV